MIIFEKVHRVFKFHQKPWLKSNIDNVVFGKTMENVRKHRDIKLVTTETRKNYLPCEPSYYTTIFSQNLLAMEMKKHK